MLNKYGPEIQEEFNIRKFTNVIYYRVKCHYHGSKKTKIKIKQNKKKQLKEFNTSS